MEAAQDNKVHEQKFSTQHMKTPLQPMQPCENDIPLEEKMISRPCGFS